MTRLITFSTTGANTNFDESSRLSATAMRMRMRLVITVRLNTLARSWLLLHAPAKHHIFWLWLHLKNCRSGRINTSTYVSLAIKSSSSRDRKYCDMARTCNILHRSCCGRGTIATLSNRKRLSVPVFGESEAPRDNFKRVQFHSANLIDMRLVEDTRIREI